MYILRKYVLLQPVARKARMLRAFINEVGKGTIPLYRERNGL